MSRDLKLSHLIGYGLRISSLYRQCLLAKELGQSARSMEAKTHDKLLTNCEKKLLVATLFRWEPSPSRHLVFCGFGSCSYTRFCITPIIKTIKENSCSSRKFWSQPIIWCLQCRILFKVSL